MKHSKKKQKESNWSLEDLLKSVETTYRYDKDNYRRYHNMRKFIYYSTVDEKQEVALRKLGKPPLSFNSLEAYVSRMRGELAKHVPSVSLSQSALGRTSADQIEFAEGYIRNVLDDANKENFQNESYDRCLTGGYNVAEVYTDYENDDSFWQDIKVKNSYDPTLCGFDPAARAPHKGDGDYCFKIYPMEIGAFKRKYPKAKIDELTFSKTTISNFSWAFRSGKTDFILVCDMYTKQEIETKVVQLPDGSSLDKEEYEDIVKNWNNVVPAPEVADERDSTKTIICRTRFIQSEILDYEETDFTYFPLVYIDGNKVAIQNSNYEVSEIRRPYFWQAISMQKLKDRAGQSWAHSLENMVAHKWIVSLEALPSEDPMIRSAYTNNQIPAVMLYHEISKDNPNVRLTPPQPVQQAPMPPEVMQAFSYAEQSFQFILGSYDSSLGINDNQLSGTAIMEGATQSNAAAMPYLMSQLQGLTRIAEIIIDLMPKYLKHKRPIEVMDKENKKLSMNINGFGSNSVSTNFDSRKLKVKIEAGVNFSIQQTKAVQQMQALAVSSPLFANFIYSEQGLPILLDNMEFHGLDRLKAALPAYFTQLKQQQQQQQQMMAQQAQSNPQMLKAKTADKKVEFEISNSKNNNALHVANISVQNRIAQNEENKIVSQTNAKTIDQHLKIQKQEIEKANASIDNALKVIDVKHRHNMDKHKVIGEHVNNMLDNVDKLNKMGNNKEIE